MQVYGHCKTWRTANGRNDLMNKDTRNKMTPEYIWSVLIWYKNGRTFLYVKMGDRSNLEGPSSSRHIHGSRKISADHNLHIPCAIVAMSTKMTSKWLHLNLLKCLCKRVHAISKDVDTLFGWKNSGNFFMTVSNFVYYICNFHHYSLHQWPEGQWY